MRRGTAVALAATMLVLTAAPGLADDRAATDRRDVDRETVDDRPAAVRPVDIVTRPDVDREQDGAVDREQDGAVDRERDRAVDREVDRAVDRERDRAVDRERDRAVDRERCFDRLTDRWCVDDRHPHVDLRHLVQRLIQAGEWEKLFRLLHRLGIV